MGPAGGPDAVRPEATSPHTRANAAGAGAGAGGLGPHHETLISGTQCLCRERNRRDFAEESAHKHLTLTATLLQAERIHHWGKQWAHFAETLK